MESLSRLRCMLHEPRKGRCQRHDVIRRCQNGWLLACGSKPTTKPERTKASSHPRYNSGHPELAHVRPRHPKTGTNGMAERFNQTLKYEHLIGSRSPASCNSLTRRRPFGKLYNPVCPHEHLDFERPDGPLPRRAVRAMLIRARKCPRFLTWDSAGDTQATDDEAAAVPAVA